MLADFFDTMGTMVAIGAEGDLLDEHGNPPKTREILVVDSLAAIAGGAGGVSSNTSYVESAAGVGEGARTGLAAGPPRRVRASEAAAYPGSSGWSNSSVRRVIEASGRRWFIAPPSSLVNRAASLARPVEPPPGTEQSGFPCRGNRSVATLFAGRADRI